MGSACSCFGLMSKVQVVFCGVGTHGQSRHHADRYQSVTSSNNQEVIPNNNNPSLRSSNNQEVEVAKLLNVTRLMTRIAVVPNAEVEAREKLTGKTGRIRLDNVEPKKPLLTFDVVPGSVQLSNDDIEDVCPTCLEEYTLENPKIVTKCSHHYHLSCIFEWQKRSETCPICEALMEFEMC